MLDHHEANGSRERVVFIVVALFVVAVCCTTDITMLKAQHDAVADNVRIRAPIIAYSRI